MHHLQDRSSLIAQFKLVRARTESLAAPLSPEDQMLQSMPDCSPTRWHRAHTTWFFETFVLAPSGVAPQHPQWGAMFNSYYEAAGPRSVRARRGMLSRPSVAEVTEYRQVVDERVGALLHSASEARYRELIPLIELGLAHEEQHQELILTDILHALSENPLRPIYRPATRVTSFATAAPLQYFAYEGGIAKIGTSTHKHRFVFDNETPRHRVWLDPFELSDRLVTVGEMKAFIRDKGYSTPSLWLSDGIDWVRSNQVQAPLYATLEGDQYLVYGLEGDRVASDDEPVTHLSFYEAEALATYLAARLPTEFELEYATAHAEITGHFLDHSLRPLPATGDGMRQLWGDAWQWTRSSYEPYPRYAPTSGALGEYNGKFMINQRVLRGGSYMTPAGHIRATYRNFWPPHTRFQVTGVRLARSV